MGKWLLDLMPLWTLIVGTLSGIGLGVLGARTQYNLKNLEIMQADKVRLEQAITNDAIEKIRNLELAQTNINILRANVLANPTSVANYSDFLQFTAGISGYLRPESAKTLLELTFNVAIYGTAQKTEQGFLTQFSSSLLAASHAVAQEIIYLQNMKIQAVRDSQTLKIKRGRRKPIGWSSKATSHLDVKDPDNLSDSRT